MSPETRGLAVETRGLGKRFATGFLRVPRVVLSGIDLELERGRSLALVGPNGSGKSTLLRVLAGVERPSAGEVRVLGAAPDDRAARGRTGFLADASPFPPELSAAETLELVGALFGMPRGERTARAAEWLRRVGLEADARTALGRYSRGMLQRFGLAQCFFHVPDLLLFDEPTSGLDAKGHVVFDELMAEARGRGASLVIASHHLSDVVDRCDDVVLLVGGRVIAAGPVSELAGESGRVRLEVEGLAGAALERVEQAIEREGARIAFKGPARETLIDWYRHAESGRDEDG